MKQSVLTQGFKKAGQYLLCMIILFLSVFYFPAASSADVTPAVAGGYEHTLALRSDGTVWAWGNNGSGQLGNGNTTTYSSTPIEVLGLPEITAIAAGYYHSMALDSSGNVWVWGFNGYGQLGNGGYNSISSPYHVSNISNIIAIAAGKFHSMAVDNNGIVYTWGGNYYDQLGYDTVEDYNPVPSAISSISNINSIAAGNYHNMAIDDSGNVWTWGSDDHGQLGDGTAGGSNSSPVHVTSISNIASIAAGGEHSMALDSSGNVWTWGRDQYGQLGDGTAGGINPSPFHVTSLSNITSIAAGACHNMVIDDSGNVWTWGSDRYGQLGDGTAGNNNPNPAHLTSISNITSIAVGDFHSMAIDDSGNVWTWGYDGYGQLGGGTADGYSPNPIQLTSISNITSIAAGFSHSMALDSSGNVWTWGSDGSCQLGDGACGGSNPSPVQLTSISNITSIAAGARHNMVIDDSGNVWSWGSNQYGQLGDGTAGASNPSPVQLTSISNITSIAAGGYHSMALDSSGNVWTWGFNQYGQLGDGTTGDPNTSPVQLTSISNITSIAAGYHHSIAIDSSGNVWTWGFDNVGQLGDGTAGGFNPNPVQLTSLSNIISIAVGYNHSMAIDDSGNVWAWGNDFHGQLGDGTAGGYSPSPFHVTSLSNITSIAAGFSHSMAIDDSGNVWTWGFDNYGQLGDGTAGGSNPSPFQLTSISNVTSITAGYMHSMAINNSGTYTWGLNDEGQLGYKKITSSPLQVHGPGDIGFINLISFSPADLIPQAIQTIPSVSEIEFCDYPESFEFKTDVQNAGTTAAENYYVQFDISGTIETVGPFTLGAGQTQAITVPWVPSVGVHSVTVTVDSTSVVDEGTSGGETNNTLTVNDIINVTADTTIPTFNPVDSPQHNAILNSVDQIELVLTDCSNITLDPANISVAPSVAVTWTQESATRDPATNAVTYVFDASPKNWPADNYTVTFTAEDSSGNSTGERGILFSVNTDEPATPAITGVVPTDDKSVDHVTGLEYSANTYNISIQGYRDPSDPDQANTSVMFDDGTGYVEVVSQGSAQWSYAPTISADDIHTLNFKLKNIAGTLSTTPAVVSITVDTAAPSPVTGQGVASCSENSITLEWTNPDDIPSNADFAGCKVVCDTDSSEADVAASVATTTTYEKTGLSKNTYYDFTVSTFDSFNPRNESTGTAISGCTLLDNPINLNASPGNGSVALTWEDATGVPSECIETYKVYYTDTLSCTGTVDVITDMPSTVLTSDKSLTIDSLTNDTTYYFAVTVQNISDGEVTEVPCANIVSATPIEGEIIHFTMETVNGSTLVNDVTAGPDGSLQGNPVQAFGYEGDVTDKVLDFDGAGDWVAVDGLSNYIQTGNNISMSCWFRTGASGADQIMFSANDAGKDDLFRIGTDGSGGIFAAVGSTGASYNSGFNDDVWHHLVAIIDAVTDSLTIRVDDTEIAAVTVSDVAWSNAVYYSLGQAWNAGGPSDTFAGQIDAFKIFNYALNPADSGYDDLVSYVDRFPPLLDSASPEDSSGVTSVSEIVITLTDLHGNVGDCTITSTDITLDPPTRVDNNNTSTFTYIPSGTPADGTHTINFTASDDVSPDANQADYSLTFTISSSTPAVPDNIMVLDSESNTLCTATPCDSIEDHVIITGTRDDNTSVWIQQGAVPTEPVVELGSGNWSADLVLAQGVNDLSIWLENIAGTPSATVSFQITVDSLVPEITSIVPGPGDILSTTPASVVINFIEANLVQASCTHSIEKNSTPVDGTWAFDSVGVTPLTFDPTVSFDDGVYTVEVLLVDAHGNETSIGPYNFTVDTSLPLAPAITSVGPTGSGSVTGSNPYDATTENVTIAGTGEADAEIWLSNTGAPAGATYLADIDSSGDWSADLTLGQGLNQTLDFYVKDTAGSMSPSIQVTITVDTIAPQFLVISPADNTFASPSQNIDIIFKEDTSGLALDDPDNGDSLYYIVKDSTSSAVPGTWSIAGNKLSLNPASDLAEGGYTVEINLVDAFGNASGSLGPYSFIVDTSAPAQLVVIDPAITAGAGNTSSPRPLISGTKADGACVLIKEGSDYRDITGYTDSTSWSWQYDLAGDISSSGTVLTFASKDRAGNQTTDYVITLTLVDTVPAAVDAPTITEDEETGNGTSVILTWSYDEAAEGDIDLYHIYYQLYDGSSAFDFGTATEAGTSSAGTMTYTVQSLTRGEQYYFAVVAEDMGNNVSSSIGVNATSPTVPPDTQSPGNVKNLTVSASTATSVTLSWENTNVNTHDDLAGFKIYEGASEVGTAASGATTWEYTGRSANSMYSLTIKSHDGAPTNNESSGVSINAYTLFDSNPNITSGTVRDGYVELTWSITGLPADNIKSYRIYRHTASFTSISVATLANTISETGSAGTDRNASATNLTNGTPYYFAVTAVNKSGFEYATVTSASYTPIADTTGPTIGTITINSSMTTTPQTIEVSVSDTASEIESVEFYLRKDEIGASDELIFTASGDGQTSGTFTYSLDIISLDDDNYILGVIASDIKGNKSNGGAAVENSFAVALAPPPVPVLDPGLLSSTNASKFKVFGTSEPKTIVRVKHTYDNSEGDPVEVLVDEIVVDAVGNFSVNANLREGTNLIKADAKYAPDRTDYNTTPAQHSIDLAGIQTPTGLTAQAKDGGAIKLTWHLSSDESVIGYNLYRDTVSDTDDIIDPSLLVNTSGPIKTTSFADPGSGLTHGTAYYYRMTAVTHTGESALSTEVSAVSDAQVPAAVFSWCIYEYDMELKESTCTTAAKAGPKETTIQLELTFDENEALAAVPFVILTPQGGMPQTIDVAIDPERADTYIGYFDIEEGTPSGDAYVVYSARDIAGNQANQWIDDHIAKNTLDDVYVVIDTAAPNVSSLELIDNTDPITSQTDPIEVVGTRTLDVKFVLDEISESSSLSYNLYDDTGAEIDVDKEIALVPLNTDPETWTGSLTLVNDVVDSHYTVKFKYNGVDEIGNATKAGDALLEDFTYLVYNGDLPPLACPANLAAEALPDGEVELTWNAVPGAASYNVYRRALGDTLWGTGVNTALPYIDSTITTDGTYEYYVTSVNSDTVESSNCDTNIVQATSDSTLPGDPTDLVSTLVGQGVKLDWVVPDYGVENVHLEIYRASDAEKDSGSVEGLASVYKNLDKDTVTVIDPNPSKDKTYYILVAVDEVGNQSNLAVSNRLNISLLPVSDILVVQNDTAAPVITWSHMNNSTMAEYKVYLNTIDDVLLHTTDNTSLSYTDIGYSGDDRVYTIVANDGTEDSIPHSITLPMISASHADNAVIKRGIMNALEYTIENHSLEMVENFRLLVSIEGEDHQSETHDIAAGSVMTVPVVIGGYDTMENSEPVETTLEIKQNPGETVQIVRNSSVDVTDGMLVLQLLTESFTKGGTGKARFILENTGDEEIEIITAKTGSEPSEVKFTLETEEGVILQDVYYDQNTGADVITIGDVTVARISAGSSFESTAVDIAVPAGAPDSLKLSLDIDNIYFGHGTPEQVTMDGLQSSRSVSAVTTSYYGQITGITPCETGSDPCVITDTDNIIISGRALREDQTTQVPYVPLSVVITLNGFERSYDVYTDENGEFEYKFEPYDKEAGTFQVCAVHPDITDRPVQSTFVVKDLHFSPSLIDVDIPVNYTQEIDITVTAGTNTSVENLHLVLNGTVPAGIEYDPPNPMNLPEGGSGVLSLLIWGNANAEAVSTLLFDVVSGPTGAEQWGQVTINAAFSEALPVLYFSPNNIETGVSQGETVTEVLTLENRGYSDMENVQLSLYTMEGYRICGEPDETGCTQVPWVYLGSSKNQGTLAVGEDRGINITFAPTQSVPEGNYMFYLLVTSDNYRDVKIYMNAVVNNAGRGSILFKVVDLYIGYVDPDTNEVNQGVKDARIMVQNRATLATVTQNTDVIGETLFEDLPAGEYVCRIRADKHEEYVDNFWIRPGVTTTHEAFLDYNLVTVTWDVNEITIEDKYEITMSATYETNVPAPVLVVEPLSIELPDMTSGDVFNGEITITNYGWIRANDLEYHLPEDGQYYDYELLDVLPDHVDAGETIIVPYRVTCIEAPFPEEGGASGGGCGYKGCAKICFLWECIGGQWVGSGCVSHCFTNSSSCSSGGPTGSGGSITIGGGGPNSSSSYSSASGIVGAQQCIPDPDKKEDDCDEDSPEITPTGSHVDTWMRNYEVDTPGLNVKVPGTVISARHTKFDSSTSGKPKLRLPKPDGLPDDDENSDFDALFSDEEDPDAEPINVISKGGVKYKRSPTDKDLFVHEELYTLRVDKATETLKWEGKDKIWYNYDRYGRVVEYGRLNRTYAKMEYFDGRKGKLKCYRDRDNNLAITFLYEGDRIKSMFDKSGRKVDYSYNLDGLLSMVSGPGSRRSIFKYDDEGRITETTVNGDYSYERKRTIEYDHQGNVIAVRDGQGNDYEFEYDYDKGKKEFVTKVTHPSGKVRELTYNQKGEKIRADQNGRNVQVIKKDGRNMFITDGRGNEKQKYFDEQGNLTRVVQPDGAEVSKEYDQKIKRPVSETKTIRATESSPERTVNKKYEYYIEEDYENKLYYGDLRRVYEAYGTEDERVFEYEYNGQGYCDVTRVLKPTVPGSDVYETVSEVTMAYDDDGNMISITNEDGQKTEFTHDISGNVLTMTEPCNQLWIFTYFEDGKLKTKRTPSGILITYKYDVDGNLLSAEPSHKSGKSFGFDLRSNMTSATRQLGTDVFATTEFSHDKDGNLKKVVDPEGKEGYYNYDDDGRLIEAMDGNGSMITFEYDDMINDGCSNCSAGSENKPSKIYVNSRYRVDFTYDARERVIEKSMLLSNGLTGDDHDYDLYTTQYFAYDDDNNLVSAVDVKGIKTLYEYDNLNRIKRKISNMQVIAEYEYDSLDNLKSITDANGHTTQFEYYANGQFKKEIRPIAEHELEYNYYDCNNFLKERIDAEGRKTSYEYDPKGRRKRIVYYGADQNPTRATTFDYDDRGAITGYTDELHNGTGWEIASSAVYTYDDIYQKLSETVTYGSGTGSFTKTHSYTYYLNGMTKTFTMPDPDTGEDVITYEYKYDDANNLSGILIPDLGQIRYTDYELGRPNAAHYPGGTSKEYGYDLIMRATSIISRTQGGSDIMNHHYEYDETDNLIRKTTEHGEYIYGSDSGGQYVSGYDNRYRLTTVNNPDFDDEAYTYDAAGNRKTSRDTTGNLINWNYNENNELLGYDNVSFDYDAHGNMIMKDDGSQIRYYNYNVENQLISVDNNNDPGDGIIASYYYDPFGRRLWKDVGGTRTYFHYSKEGLVAEYDAFSDEIKSYGYRPGSFWTTGPIFMRTDGSDADTLPEYYFYHTDINGTPHKITSVNSAVVWSTKYGAFGETISIDDYSSGIVNNLRFAGQYFDDETGFHYNWNRYYDPSIGRYITPDPIRFASGDLNLYRYAFNDPVNLIDPNGEVVPLLVVWALIELGLSLYDIYDLYKTLTNPCSTPADIAFAISMFLVGVGMPGGGYTAADDIIKHADDIKRFADEAIDEVGEIFEHGHDLRLLGDGMPTGAQICFEPGTLVLMGDGTTKAIEDIEKGDYVFGDDPEDSEEPKPFKVLKIYNTSTGRLFNIQFGGSFVKATSRHPFWTQRGWVAAEGLEKDDLLYDLTGNWIEIDSINIEFVETPTHNLLVEEVHTFYVVVGELNVLVHNLDPWEIEYSRLVGADEVFQHGDWAGRTVAEAIEEAKKLGKLPEGLKLEAARYYTAAGEEIIATVNNRTLYVAQQADLPQVHPANDIDSPNAQRKLQKQLNLAADKGGTGMTFKRCP